MDGTDFLESQSSGRSCVSDNRDGGGRQRDTKVSYYRSRSKGEENRGLQCVLSGPTVTPSPC